MYTDRRSNKPKIPAELVRKENTKSSRAEIISKSISIITHYWKLSEYHGPVWPAEAWPAQDIHLTFKIDLEMISAQFSLLSSSSQSSRGANIDNRHGFSPIFFNLFVICEIGTPWCWQKFKLNMEWRGIFQIFEILHLITDAKPSRWVFLGHHASGSVVQISDRTYVLNSAVKEACV